MKLTGKIIVVTGGAQGIGAALCERFAQEGAKAVVVADLNFAGAEAVAAKIGGAAMACDVSREEDIIRLIDDTETRFGPIDLFCSNAGIAVLDPDWDNPASASDDGWARSWAVNVMAHVYAARHLVPRMSARGGGYFLNTVSAAGLLSQIGGGPYATTKHAALGFAENLAIATRDRGIKVSVLCPQGVDTPMLRGIDRGVPDRDGVLTAF
jgi:NAD(P)-dependent dehydrogenase (short-subunit alcohol dehydrogenase family)